MCSLTNLAIYCNPAFNATILTGMGIIYTLGFIAWDTFRTMRARRLR